MSTREEGWDHIHETIIQCAAIDAVQISLNDFDSEERANRDRVRVSSMKKMYWKELA
jgi:hypothetical protein